MVGGQCTVDLCEGIVHPERGSFVGGSLETDYWPVPIVGCPVSLT